MKAFEHAYPHEDAPFGALDIQTRYVLQDELMRIWNTKRKTVLFVTHSIEEALYLADRIAGSGPGPGIVAIPKPLGVAELAPFVVAGTVCR